MKRRLLQVLVLLSLTSLACVANAASQVAPADYFGAFLCKPSPAGNASRAVMFSLGEYVTTDDLVHVRKPEQLAYSPSAGVDVLWVGFAMDGTGAISLSLNGRWFATLRLLRPKPDAEEDYAPFVSLSTDQGAQYECGYIDPET